MERVSKLEKLVAEATERQAREARAVKAKLDSFDLRVSAVKEAWGQETPRI